MSCSIDGFINEEGSILNDPNTTSGMMPSSFSFIRPAWNRFWIFRSFPTYIIRTFFGKEKRTWKYCPYSKTIEAIGWRYIILWSAGKTKIRANGHYGWLLIWKTYFCWKWKKYLWKNYPSSKIRSHSDFFLSGNNEHHQLYQIPVNSCWKTMRMIFVKGNALWSSWSHSGNQMECENITSKYTDADNVLQPVRFLCWTLLNSVMSCLSLLHGRPGEDGECNVILNLLVCLTMAPVLTLQSYHQQIRKQTKFYNATDFPLQNMLLVNIADWNLDKNAFVKIFFNASRFHSLQNLLMMMQQRSQKIRNEEELIFLI